MKTRRSAIPEAVPSRPGRAAPQFQHSLRTKQSSSPKQRSARVDHVHSRTSCASFFSRGRNRAVPEAHLRGRIEITLPRGCRPGTFALALAIWENAPILQKLHCRCGSYSHCVCCQALGRNAIVVSGQWSGSCTPNSRFPEPQHRKALLRAKPAERRRRRATGLRCIHVHHASRAASVGTFPRSPFAGGPLFIFRAEVRS